MKRTIIAVAMTTVLAACGGREEPAPADESADDTAGMPGMSGMQGMQNMPSGTMMGEMRMHMDSMRGMNGERMRQILPAHRQMVANMLAQFNREMRDMNMSADARWNALTDSIRTDLTNMPDMSSRELQALMPDHGARVMRLMDMHESMTRNMGM